MLSPVGRWFALAALVASVAGCHGTTPVTELVVVVHADLPVPTLRVTATSPEGTMPVDARVASPSFPVSVVLTRDHAPYGPVTIHVEGGGVVSDATTELVPGERRRLDVTLSSSCLCSSCTAPQTCRGGSCVDRTVAASTLPAWAPGTDAAVAPGLDGGMTSDASAASDAGPSGPTCGCMGQPCCGTSMCNGTLSCRSDVCMDCVTNDPMISGMTPPTAMFLVGIAAINDTLWVSSSDGMVSTQAPLRMTGSVTATGTATVMQVQGVSTSGNTMHVRGTTGAMATITLSGATLTGSFSAPTHPGGAEGVIAGVSASGRTITFTAWDGSHGTIMLMPVEVCR